MLPRQYYRDIIDSVLLYVLVVPVLAWGLKVAQIDIAYQHMEKGGGRMRREV
jgi:hypothetical protein